MAKKKATKKKATKKKATKKKSNRQAGGARTKAAAKKVDKYGRQSSSFGGAFTSKETVTKVTGVDTLTPEIRLAFRIGDRVQVGKQQTPIKVEGVYFSKEGLVYRVASGGYYHEEQLKKIQG